MSVNLNFSKDKINKQLATLIKRLKANWEEKQLQKRQRHHYDKYPKYLNVYDLHEKEKLGWPEIADRIFPDEQDRKNAATKVREHYYEVAKEIIKDVEHF